MKVSELISLLETYQDFDISFVFTDGRQDGFLDVRKFIISGIGDIGHSDKMVQLEGDEEI